MAEEQGPVERIHFSTSDTEYIDATCERTERDYTIDERKTGFWAEQCENYRGPFPTFRDALAMVVRHAEIAKFWPNIWFVDLQGAPRLVTQEEIDQMLDLGKPGKPDE